MAITSNSFFGGHPYDPRDVREFEERLRLEEERMYREQLQRIQNQMMPISRSWAGIDVPTTPKVDPAAIEALKTVAPRKVTRRMPDSISVITAWRAWGLNNANGEWRLKALGKNTVWEPKKKFEATCEAGKSHPAPQKECTCGVWSFKNLDLLIPALKTYDFRVIGSVSLWGRVIETENGFRSQYAYPAELWLLDNSLEELGWVYGVPIRTATTEHG